MPLAPTAAALPGGLPVALTSDLVSGYLLGGLLILTRLAVLLTAVPGVSAGTLPARTRLLLAGALAVVMDLALGPVFVAPPDSLVAPALLLAREALLGGGMALALRMVISAVEAAGSVAGISMALSMNLFVDPHTGERTLSLGALMGITAGLVFTAVGGHRVVLQALFAHLQAYPVGVEELALPTATGLAQALVAFTRTALLLAAPVVVSSLVVYIALALISRVVPQMNLFGIGLGMVIMAGLLALSMEGEAVQVAVTRGVDALPAQMVHLSTGGP